MTTEPSCPMYHECWQASPNRTDCYINQTQMDAQLCKWFTPPITGQDIHRYVRKSEARRRTREPDIQEDIGLLRAMNSERSSS